MVLKHSSKYQPILIYIGDTVSGLGIWYDINPIISAILEMILAIWSILTTYIDKKGGKKH